jgi:hypothetical protein
MSILQQGSPMRRINRRSIRNPLALSFTKLLLSFSKAMPCLKMNDRVLLILVLDHSEVGNPKDNQK